MATIKMFRGSTPPLLKTGEWASNGNYAFLGMEGGEYKVYQGVFDMGKNQDITGFLYSVDKRAIIIPEGTAFSRLQELFDNLPKALKYHTNEKGSIDILFEDGTYINDLGTWLVIRDFSYQINIKSLSDQEDQQTGQYEKPVVFQSDKAIEIYISAVNFSDIRFEYTDSQNGSLAFLNSTSYINDCSFDARVNAICVTDRGYNKIVFSDAFFKMNRDVEDSILDKAAVGSFINIARSKSDIENKPKSIVTSLEGGIIIAGNVEDLHISEKSSVYLPNGGIEVHGAFVMHPDGTLDVSVPSKLSQLENDLGFTSNYNELKNLPVTISESQASAIEANSEKRSYPKGDAEKLATVEEHATAGADWETNVKNKPVTISQEQAEAIEENSKKNSYPPEDLEKLATVEEKATEGADWDTNLKNIPEALISILVASITAGLTNMKFDLDNNVIKLVFEDKQGNTTVKSIELVAGTKSKKK
jgi:hypothetical protein